jgi:hypothetical protein
VADQDAPQADGLHPSEWYDQLRVKADGVGHSIWVSVGPGKVKTGQNRVLIPLTDLDANLEEALAAVEKHLADPRALEEARLAQAVVDAEEAGNAAFAILEQTEAYKVMKRAKDAFEEAQAAYDATVKARILQRMIEDLKGNVSTEGAPSESTDSPA